MEYHSVQSLAEQNLEKTGRQSRYYDCWKVWNKCDRQASPAKFTVIYHSERQNDDPGTRAVLWDMDGTLLDSAEYHWLSWREVLAAEGFELTRERFTESFGRRNDSTLRAYFGEEFPLSEVERIGDIKEARYREMVRKHGVELLPGVDRWLARLKVDGWRQALASSASLLNVETILGGLKIADFFDAIVSAEDVQTGKPDPEVFLVAAARVSATAARCVVIEDAPAGIEAARLAGMRTIGVQTSHTSLSADLVVHTLDELPDDAFDRLVGERRIEAESH